MTSYDVLVAGAGPALAWLLILGGGGAAAYYYYTQQREPAQAVNAMAPPQPLPFETAAIDPNSQSLLEKPLKTLKERFYVSA